MKGGAACSLCHQTHPPPPRQGLRLCTRRLHFQTPLQLGVAMSDSGQLVENGRDISSPCVFKREWVALHPPSHFLWAGRWMWCWGIGFSQAEDGNPTGTGRTAGQRNPGPRRSCGARLLICLRAGYSDPARERHECLSCGSWWISVEKSEWGLFVVTGSLYPTIRRKEI